jgi:hypothetical protein
MTLYRLPEHFIFSMQSFINDSSFLKKDAVTINGSCSVCFFFYSGVMNAQHRIQADIRLLPS